MNKNSELNIIVADSDHHIIGITESCFGKIGWEEGAEEY